MRSADESNNGTKKRNLKHILKTVLKHKISFEIRIFAIPTTNEPR